MSSILQMNKVRQGEFNELALVPWSCVCVCVGGGRQGSVWVRGGQGCPVCCTPAVDEGGYLGAASHRQMWDIPNVVCLIISFRLGILNLGATRPSKSQRLVSGDCVGKSDTKFGM